MGGGSGEVGGGEASGVIGSDSSLDGVSVSELELLRGGDCSTGILFDLLYAKPLLCLPICNLAIGPCDRRNVICVRWGYTGVSACGGNNRGSISSARK
jgi:hypothetical protein